MVLELWENESGVSSGTGLAVKDDNSAILKR